uniref:Ankyrin repeat protein n=1 Tax=Meloidogyne hapla TaxID=6305 RepID=A0A1I8BFG5_MELHA
MKTINCRTNWTIQEIKKIQSNLSSNNKIHLSSNRFFNSDFPKVAWQLFIEIMHHSPDYSRRYDQSYSKRENDFIYIWLTQMGPNGLNDVVNTKYRIYAIVEENTNIDIVKYLIKII